MKTKIFSSALMAALLVLAPVVLMAQEKSAEVSTAGAPKAQIEESTYDAGSIKAGSVVEHDFIVKNVGDADLMILDVVPGCSCSVSDFDKVIAPGQSGKVAIKVHTYPEWAGQKLNKSAYMTTNDPEGANTRLYITADILPDAAKPPLNSGQ